ncbi:hypothetical protein K4F52_001720 [Lecanicillium sp. MT-2017a]|nr:hypothetical protein K4F52_001720 [Lecanicillium sp. MT-2017a]
MLLVLPSLYKPQFAVHSCRRCGLRLALATTGFEDYRFTLTADMMDDSYAPAEDDWRPDLARLPGGTRIARSPLGPRPEISETDMKVSSTRYALLKPRARISLASRNWLASTVQCSMIADGDADQPPPRTAQEREARKGPVFCQIHLEAVGDLSSHANSNSRIEVTMLATPDGALHNSAATTQADTDDSDGTTPPYEFVETCRIRFHSGQNYSIDFHLPSNEPPSYASPSGGTVRKKINSSPCSHRFRTQFYPGMPVWRWKSSEGYLLWVSRRYRDVEMTAPNTAHCLVDEYERLVAVVEGMDTIRVVDVTTASGVSFATNAMRECTMKLYADLDPGVLGEILGSYCALIVQMGRVAKVLKRERDEARSRAA